MGTDLFQCPFYFARNKAPQNLGDVMTSKNFDQDVVVQLTEVKQRMGLLGSSLPTSIDPVGISRVKLASMPLWCRETMIWRIHELGTVAVESFDTGRGSAGMVLVRGVFESALVVFLIENEMQKFEPSQHNRLKSLFEKLWAGESNDVNSLPPITPGKLIGLLKANKNIKRVYDRLSNYTHPNRSAQRLSSKYDRETAVMSFGQFPEESIVFGLKVLNETLALFEKAYNSITDLMPKFVEKCEIAVPEEFEKKG